MSLARLYPSLAPGVYRQMWVGIVPYHFCFQVGLVATGAAAIALAGSALEVGLILGAWGVPILFMPPFGGVAADRYPRRRTMLAAQVVLGAAALVIGVLALTGRSAVWQLVVLGLIQGVVYAFFAPARNAYTAQAVPKALVPNAAAAYSLSEHAGAVLGPALGGLLIAGLGLGFGWAYVLVALTHAAIFAIFASLPEQAPNPDASGGHVLDRIREGIRYARGFPSLRVVLALSALAMILGMPYRQLMPVFADRVYGVGAGGLGTLLAAAGAGAILGSIAVSRFRGDRGLGRWPGILGAVFGLAAFLFALAPSFEAGIVAVAVAGGATAAFTTTNSAVVASSPTPAYYGRTASLYQLTFALGPLGAIPIGALADRIGAPQAVAAGGLLLALAAPTVARLLGRTGPEAAAQRATPTGTTTRPLLEEDPMTGTSPGFAVRRATAEDVPAAQALMRTTVEVDFGTPYRPDYHRDIADLTGFYLEPDRHALFVAVDGATGEVVGTGGIRVGKLRGGPRHLVRRYAGEDTAQLVRIYVRQDHRRRGIARAIVRACLRFALDDGGYRIFALHTFPHSPGALAFWSSMATQVGEQPHTEIPPQIFFEFDPAVARAIAAGEWPARPA